ncbi:hypothetical protein BU23DRAFT_97116 [Bimuria novae-zelandiae CBS 107.79]|uniref:Uncharacterized protein n=1 Tax=Bimuria novae-zelandiae CBS 107.79 TaxID=1447943 RepID=A0A6A5VHW1_9PLEO|nr:hypothetical protein BU23DRAFT_97116 [Bimuria novae-zelandiae CBS 107.79]
MADVWRIIFTILFYLWWPTSKLLSAIAFALSPFWALAQFVFLPVAYLAEGIYAILSFPFRLHILERIETIYIWVGVAGLIGCIAGAGLFLLFTFITSVFKIDGAAEARSKAKGRTMKEFRAARRGKKEPHTQSPSGPRIDRVAALRRRGLTAQPILEEESEF